MLSPNLLISPARRAARIVLCAVTLAACSSVGGQEGDTALAFGDAPASSPSVVPAQATSSIVVSTPLESIAPELVRQRIYTVPRPAKIVAEDEVNISETLGHLARATSRPPGSETAGRWVQAAQIGLLFGSPEGKAFLAAEQGRAMVRGEPAEMCPVLTSAAAGSDTAAAEGALRSCLNQLDGRDGCGCRLIATGDRLLAPRRDFTFALGVAGHLVTPATGEDVTLTAEERLIEGRPGARRVWFLGFNGPVAMLQVEPGGRAALMFEETGKRYDGVHFADGFRRGRTARRAYLTAPDGEQIIALVGFEATEIARNHTKLTAWSPDQTLDLRKAEAN